MRSIIKPLGTAFFWTFFIVSSVFASDAKIRVVTSFSILEDLTSQLGGQHVSIVNLVDRNADAHTYQPKPSDSVAIAQAELIIFNGLGFEGWIARLLENGDKKNSHVIASEGVDAIRYEDEIDPHAWQSFSNARRYINNITRALIALRPQHSGTFVDNQRRYLSELDTLEEYLIKQLDNIPKGKRIVVTSHDAFAYLGREFDIQFYAPHGVNLEVEASAADVAAVINQIREQQVKALFVENITSPRLLERIASETDVSIGGSLYSDALSEESGPADTYLKMMRHNLESLINAFSSIH